MNAREWRDKAGQFLLSRGHVMRDRIDAGIVQDYLEEYAAHVRREAFEEAETSCLAGDCPNAYGAGDECHKFDAERIREIKEGK